MRDKIKNKNLKLFLLLSTDDPSKPSKLTSEVEPIIPQRYVTPLEENDASL